MNMKTTKNLVTGILIAAAALFAGCASQQQWGVMGEGLIEPGIEGEWTAPAGSPMAGMVVEIERNRGDVYEVDVEKGRGGVESETEADYPMRLIRIGGATLVEVEAARGTSNGRDARVYIYGKTEIAADTLTFRQLDTAWMNNYAKGKNISTTQVPGAGPTAGLAAAQGPQLRAMLEAAVADTAAWGQPEVWTRVKE
jgi:hypothetical protein